MESANRKNRYLTVSRGRSGTLFALVLFVAVCAGSGAAQAQKLYDDHDLTDRFYITAGGFSQNDIRTTLRVDAKSVTGAITLGTVISLESLFDVEDKVNTGRLDGWYRFNKKHRINWTYWRTRREGVSTYNGDTTIEIGDDIKIETGNNVVTEDINRLIALGWTYSFLNTSKYELWLGAGLNFQTIDTEIVVNTSGTTNRFTEDVRATVPIPTINFGGRWNFGKRWRMILQQQIFGLKIGDFSGKRENTRILAEVNLTKNFGIGGGLERYNFEVNAEGENFLGELDVGYSAISLYLKGQL